MAGLFKQYHNFLSDEVLKKVQDTYMTDDIDWVHRNYGRFFIYLNEDDHEAVLHDLYNNNPDVPTYHNNRMMRNHHMYIQRFVPGSWLPVHRERCYGVLVIYINPDEDWGPNNVGPKFVYYDTEDLNEFDAHRHEVDISCNTGAVYMVEKGTTEYGFNVWHGVELNKTDKSRYAIQMFFGPGVLSTTQDPRQQFQLVPTQQKQKSSIINQAHTYGDTKVNQTERAIMTGTLDVADIDGYTMGVEEWNKNNPEIIERLTGNG